MRSTLLVLALVQAWLTPAWAQKMPVSDVRVQPDFLAGLVSYKKAFKRPEWAQPGIARQVRFDGGPMFAASQLESGWNYLFDTETPGFVGVIQATPSLVNFYTEDIERRLDEVRAAGYNWVWLSYHLGFALDDEEEQRRQVRHAIQLAHVRGIRVTAYVSLTSLFTRSVFLRQPESKSWVQERPDGTPVAYANVPVRLMACVNKPGRLEHLKRVVSMAVADGADDIHYDSIFNRCYCQFCKKGFREYSQRVLGHAHEPPAHSGAQAPSGIEERAMTGEASSDPIWALFTEYSGYTVARALAELDRHAKSINPAVTLSANSHQIRYIDQVTDMTWSEDANTQGSRIVEGKLETPLAAYAWGQALSGGKKPFQATVMPYHYWTIQPPDYYELTVAEAGSFQANFTMLAGYSFGSRMFRKEPATMAAWRGIGKGLRFVEKNQSLYQNARPVADVAVYYSHTSRAHADSLKRKYEWERLVQALFVAGTPATILIDELVLARGAETLVRESKAIILTEATCLSDEEVALFTQYLEKGGSLIVSSRTGSYSSFFVKRASTPWGRRQAQIHVVDGRSWVENSTSVRELLGKALGRESVILIAGNGFQVGNLTLTNGLGVVHLLNYDRANPRAALRVRIGTTGNPEWDRVLQGNPIARWIPTSGDAPVELALRRTNSGIEVTVPELKLAGLIVLESRRGTTR